MISYYLHNGNYIRTDNPVITSAKGAFLTSIEGIEYFDAGLGAGSQLFGHAPSAIVEAISEQISKGSIYLNNNPQIHELCETLSLLLPSSQNHYVFCNSGSEATQRAVRLARSATDRQKIAYFHGGWHGMNEWTLYDDGDRFGKKFEHPPSGIPDLVHKSSLQLPYNDERAFNIIEQNSDSIAAVIIEPVQGSNPRDDILNFLQGLHKCCKNNGILLILDEIITGFRFSGGGIANLWKLEPDIVTYGKILGGGLPVGLVTCTQDVANYTFNSPNKNILTGGTFSANPLVAVAANAVLKLIQKADYGFIDGLASIFRTRLNGLFELSGLPMTVIGVGSFSRVLFTGEFIRNRDERDSLELPIEIQQKFRQRLLDLNVIWPANGLIFTGFCHDFDMIDNLCEKVFDAAHYCLQ